MSNRVFLSRFYPALLALALTALLAGQTASKPAASRKTSTIARTRDGHPDLQSIWTNATLTPLERPAAFAGKLTVSDAEAAVYEKQQIDELKAGDGKSDSDFH